MDGMDQGWVKASSPNRFKEATKVREDEYGENRGMIGTDLPLVVAPACTGLHSMNALVDAIFNGRPVASFKVQILYFFLAETSPVPTLEYTVLDNVKRTSKDIVCSQLFASRVIASTHEAQMIDEIGCGQLFEKVHRQVLISKVHFLNRRKIYLVHAVHKTRVL
jgi:hypothetical protein